MRTAGPGDLDRFPTPRGLHRGDRGVEALVAIGEVLVQRGELGFEIAGAAPEDQPPGGHDVEGERGLGQEIGVAVRDDAEIRQHPESAWSRPRPTSRATNGSSVW